MKNELDFIKWKLELADAIIEEAIFNNFYFEIGADEIEHQLGTVWVGNVAITMMKTEKEKV